MVVEVAYIGGYGRSGSSLLDMLMARHAGAMSGGEVSLLFRWSADGRKCSCGDAVEECEVWGGVIERVNRLTGSAPLMEVHWELQKAERRHGSASDVWRRVWGAAFEELGRLGVERLVDSSKTAGGRARPLLLSELDSAKVVVLAHLVRRPEGVLNSSRRGNNFDLESNGRQARVALYAREYETIRASFGWLRANQLMYRIARQGRFPYAPVQYESLCATPDAVVGQLADYADWAGTTSGSRDHAIAGNRFRRGQWSGAITEDDDWKLGLPPMYKALGRSTAYANGLLSRGWDEVSNDLGLIP